MKKKVEIKMGRKPIPLDQKVKIAHVWLIGKEMDTLEGMYGSLTNAIKTALPSKEQVNNLKFTVNETEKSTAPLKLTGGDLTKKIIVKEIKPKAKPNNDYLERRRNAKNAVKANS